MKLPKLQNRTIPGVGFELTALESRAQHINHMQWPLPYMGSWETQYISNSNITVYLEVLTKQCYKSLTLGRFDSYGHMLRAKGNVAITLL